jgi:hypothetical protein
MVTPDKGFPMRHQEFLRAQAARCFELADIASEPKIARELRAIGQAFLQRADELDAAQASGGTSDDRGSSDGPTAG